MGESCPGTWHLTTYWNHWIKKQRLLSQHYNEDQVASEPRLIQIALTLISGQAKRCCAQGLILPNSLAPKSILKAPRANDTQVTQATDPSPRENSNDRQSLT